MTPILQTATRYVAAGYSVVPIAPDATKRPTVKWERWQHEIAHPTEHLPRLFPPNFRGGVAIIHGAVSSNSECLDFDDIEAYYELSKAILGGDGEGKDGDPLLIWLTEACHVQTPSGGRHIYHRCEEPPDGNLKLAYGADNKIRIETRGEAGYTLAPGSPSACHPTGNQYGKIAGSPFTHVPVITTATRTALLSLCRSLDKRPKPESRPLHATRRNQSGRVERPYGAIKPGDDYSERATQADVLNLLLAAGWTISRERSDAYELARPGKNRGLSATLGYDAPNVLHVFTSNAPGFQVPDGNEGRAFPPFAVYATLKHAGSYTDAARDLAAQGYGDDQTLRQRRRAGLPGLGGIK